MCSTPGYVGAPLLPPVGWPPRAGDLWVRLEVEPLLKQDITDAGAVVQVPVNIFDCDPELGLYAKPFIRLFEDRFYFWGCVEMLRKLFQTSFTVVIQIADARFDLLYTLLVSYLFLGVQGYFSPYADDIDDRLSLAFLVNEFLLLLSLVGVTFVERWDNRKNGFVLCVLQVIPLNVERTFSRNIWVNMQRPFGQHSVNIQ